MEYVYTDDAECCGWLTKIGSLIYMSAKNLMRFYSALLAHTVRNVLAWKRSLSMKGSWWLKTIDFNFWKCCYYLTSSRQMPIISN